jgi:hypothetical protein
MFVIIDPCFHLFAATCEKVSGTYEKNAEWYTWSNYANIGQYQTTPTYDEKYYLFDIIHQPPANTSEDPAATAVHPDMASPTRPQPLLLMKTDVLPTAMGAACAGHGLPGNR